MKSRVNLCSLYEVIYLYEIEKKITDAIEIMVNSYLKTLQYDYSPIAKITAIVTGTPNTYSILMNGQTYIGIRARAGLTLSVGSIVYAKVPMGVLSSIYIDSLVP